MKCLINEKLTEEIDDLFKKWDKPDSPGCALGIIKDGKFIYKKGYGTADLEHDVPITPQTIFCVGSMTKQFRAMCILLLAEQNRISLDDDIRKFLPKFPDYNQSITIRHLIHHTSGILEFVALLRISGKSLYGDITKQEVMRIILRQKQLNFAPGEEMLYSNSNYALLSTIIENITGKSIREFGEENIFKPLGMKNTQFIVDNKNIIKNRAFMYFPNGEEGYFNSFLRSHIGQNMVYSNVEDLFLWDQNYYTNKLGKTGGGLIKTMQTPYKLNNGKEGGYAFGLGIDQYGEQKRIWHNGGLGGYKSQYISFPDHRLSVIILSNLSNTNPVLLANKVTDILLEKIVDDFKHTKISVDPKIYQNYVGKYLSEKFSMATISSENNRLMFQNLGFPRTELIPESEISFHFEGLNVRLTFEKDENELNSKYVLHQQGLGKDEIYKRIKPPTLTQGELKEYVGEYFNEENDFTFPLLIKNNGLYHHYLAKFEMEYLENDKFQTWWALFRFLRTENGNIEGFELDTPRARNIWFKRK